MGKSEQLSYTITIVDTHVCMFFDGVLEEMLERNLSVHHRKHNKYLSKSTESVKNKEEIK